MNKNVARRTKYHDFKDKNGKHITYAILEAIFGQSTEWIKTQLRHEKRVPENLHDFVKTIIAPGTKRINELKQRQEEAETLIKEEKLREIQWKNEITEGMYILIEDVQRDLDGALIRLQTNLYAIPDQIVDSIMTSRDRTEAMGIITEALERHMKDVSEWTVGVNEGD